MAEIFLCGSIFEAGNECDEFFGANLFIVGHVVNATASVCWRYIDPFDPLVKAEPHIVPKLFSKRMCIKGRYEPQDRVDEWNMMNEIIKSPFGNYHVPKSLPMN